MALFFSTDGRKQQVSEPTVNNEDEVDKLELYKRIQKGGDIPIKGLQKPAPEKTASEYSRGITILHVFSPYPPRACFPFPCCFSVFTLL